MDKFVRCDSRPTSELDKIEHDGAFDFEGTHHQKTVAKWHEDVTNAEDIDNTEILIQSLNQEHQESFRHWLQHD